MPHFYACKFKCQLACKPVCLCMSVPCAVLVYPTHLFAFKCVLMEKPYVPMLWFVRYEYICCADDVHPGALVHVSICFNCVVCLYLFMAVLNRKLFLPAENIIHLKPAVCIIWNAVYCETIALMIFLAPARKEKYSEACFMDIVTTWIWQLCDQSKYLTKTYLQSDICSVGQTGLDLYRICTTPFSVCDDYSSVT